MPRSDSNLVLVARGKRYKGFAERLFEIPGSFEVIQLRLWAFAKKLGRGLDFLIHHLSYDLHLRFHFPRGAAAEQRHRQEEE